jgi:iron complex outermembrane receptor protein
MTIKRIAGRPLAVPLALRSAPLTLAIATSLGTMTAPAMGQEASGLEEIVVTARFREENIQTTPISISAFSGEDLELRSIDNIEDLGLVIPNAYFRRNVSNFGPNNTIGLRGLNQVDFSYSFEPTVALYIDDMYHSTVTGSDMDLIDLERVEVLRGPQGTLFGKNSLGGSIRMISKKPQGDNTGSVQVTFGDYDRLDIKAIGDIALIEDKLFARIVGVTKERQGHGASLDFTCEMIRRGTPELAGLGDGIGADGSAGAGTDGQPDMVTAGSAADNDFSFPAARDVLQGDGCEIGKLGGTSSEAGRVVLRYLPTDKLDFNLAAYVSNSVDDPNVDTQLTPQGGFFETAYENAVVYPNYGIRYTIDDRFVTGDPYTNYATFADPVEGQVYPRDAVLDSSGASLVAEYQISDNVSAKFILSDRQYDFEWTGDSDRGPFATTQTHYVQNHDQQQAEVQFNGVLANDRMDWAAGVFYFESESRAYNTTEFGGFDITGLLPNFVANDGFGTDNTSVFFHVTYDFTDRVSVSGGVRYTDESKFNTFAHIGQIVVADPLLFGDSRSDWKASVEFAATDEVFVYAQAATGFTSEGATPRIFTAGQLRSIVGEELISYEIGAKLEFLESRLRVNAAVFTSEYDPRSIQVGGVNQCDAPDDPDPFPYRLSGDNCPPGTFFGDLPMPTQGLPWFYYDNIPGTLDGFEVEVTATPIENLLINYSAGQNEYQNDPNIPGMQGYRDPDFRSQPEWNMSLGVQYAVQLPSGGTITPRFDAFYQSFRNNGPGNVPNSCPVQCIPSYTIYNARLTYSPPDRDWRLSLSGTNLTDKFYWQQVGAALTTDGAVPTNRSGVASRPREWALMIEKQF